MTSSTSDKQDWYVHRDMRHPMEVIPALRRFKPGFWRDFLFTLVFNTLIAVFFTTIASMFSGGSINLVRTFGVNMVISQCIGFTMGVAMHYLTKFLVMRQLMPARPTIAVGMAYVLVAIGCTLVGYAIAAAILGWENWTRWLFTKQNIVVVSIFCASISLSVLFIMQSSYARLQNETRGAQAAAALERSQRDLATSELKTLRAQVEPHFLYNSLAHVSTLIDVDPPKAKLMIDRLIALLRNNVEGSRDNVSSIARELDGVENYLGILKLRMGDRLEYSVSGTDAARACVAPPMVLQPLVENAIKHGLEPKINGGRIDVRAEVADGMARVTIQDTGLGFGAVASTSTGTGLANLKARLRATCGDRAKLAISETVGGGVTITLTLPTGDSPA
jgi:sensor histidine kinase YesM